MFWTIPEGVASGLMVMLGRLELAATAIACDLSVDQK